MFSIYKQPPEVIKKCLDHPGLRCYVHQYYNFSLYEAFKLYIFPGPLGFAVRIAAMFILFTIHFLLQKLIFLNYKDWDIPAPIWRRKASQLTLGYSCMALFFAAGFYWIKYIDHSKFRPKSKNWEDQPRFNYLEDKYPLVGNHCSFMDMFNMCLGAPSWVVRSGVKKLLTARFIMKVFRWLFVYRNKQDAPEGYSVSQVLKDRVEEAFDPKQEQNSPYAPLVFPEGTTSNGQQITRFHKGVFVPGRPVRPFAIKYPGKHFSNHYDAIPAIRLIYGMLTQFWNPFEVQIFDLYIPNEDERSNPDLYAANVGRFVAQKLDIPYIDGSGYSYSKLVSDILIDNKVSIDQIDSEVAKLDLIQEREKQDRKENGIELKKQQDKLKTLV
ncbi:MAG: putative Lysophospholipid acyltransferase [Streblomastix strix]|uniref:Putative Lysophospholipid acyltransferase n=1 Tax=Streblomastix strix TaxID=222440 RepID=A0A5J4X1G0_9EUKA|nr:MAG: putative Lysophospholipid acyltransferase [Streblomastix strix]